MFLNTSPIIVPFLSAIDIFQYVENLGLTVSTTGSYYILSAASNNFSGSVPITGLLIYTSGIGNWGPGSGFAFISTNYLYDNNASYNTGFNTGYLSSGTQISGYKIFTPILNSGLMTLNLDYMYENFSSYSTGLYTQGTLPNGNQISGYFIYYPNNYLGIFSFGSAIKPTGFYTTTDNANPFYTWSGSGININPGAGNTFPYLQPFASNSLAPQGSGFGGGPYYAAGSGNAPWPWTGGGPVLVGNVAVNQVNGANQAPPLTKSGGYISMTGFGSGITGDFTLNIIWNWNQNTSANTSYNLTGLQSTVGNWSGSIPVAGAVTSTGSTASFISVLPQIISGSPLPNGINMGLDYNFPYNFYSTGSRAAISFQTPYVTNINQDTALLDYDMLSGFAIYIYTSIWSGATWIGPDPQKAYGSGNTNIVIGSNTSYNSTVNGPFLFYTGMSSGLISNIYAFVLGNKISGSAVSTNLPTGFIFATGFTGYTGQSIASAPFGTGFYTATGYFGGVSGIIANGPMAQFTGFGFGIAQYITLTRTGTTVSLYQSGLLMGTGYASGIIYTKLPLTIGEFNTKTGVFTGCYSGFGLYHFELWNSGMNQQAIQNNLLTYISPPQNNLISSTNFILR